MGAGCGKGILFRYRARNFPGTLDEQEQRRWALHCREVFESQIEEYMLNLENLVHEHESAIESGCQCRG